MRFWFKVFFSVFVVLVLGGCTSQKQIDKTEVVQILTAVQDCSSRQGCYNVIEVNRNGSIVSIAPSESLGESSTIFKYECTETYSNTENITPEDPFTGLPSTKGTITKWECGHAFAAIEYKKPCAENCILGKDVDMKKIFFEHENAVEFKLLEIKDILDCPGCHNVHGGESWITFSDENETYRLGNVKRWTDCKSVSCTPPTVRGISFLGGYLHNGQNIDCNITQGQFGYPLAVWTCENTYVKIRPLTEKSLETCKQAACYNGEDFILEDVYTK